MKRLPFLFFSVLLLSIFLSCRGNDENQLFELLDPEKSGVHFNNTVIENDSINVLEFMNLYTGGGVAAGDVNNDGLPDLFFSGNMVSSRLYINKSTRDKIQFEDVTEKSGVETAY